MLKTSPITRYIFTVRQTTLKASALRKKKNASFCLRYKTTPENLKLVII